MPDWLPLRVPLGVAPLLSVAVAVFVPVEVALLGPLPLRLGEFVTGGVALAELVSVPLELPVIKLVPLPETVIVPVREGVTVPLVVTVGVKDGDGVDIEVPEPLMLLL